MKYSSFLQDRSLDFLQLCALYAVTGINICAVSFMNSPRVVCLFNSIKILCYVSICCILIVDVMLKAQLFFIIDACEDLLQTK